MILSRRAALVAFTFLCAGTTGPAFAQATSPGAHPAATTSAGAGASEQDGQVGTAASGERQIVDPGPFFAAPMGSQHLFGDWGGIQPWLLNHGIHLLLAINEELAGNVTGGRERTYTDAGQVGAEMDIDWSRLAGIPNFWTHTIVVNGHGNNLSSKFGDQIAGVQEIYGARGNVVAHLVALWGESAFYHNRIDISAGWIPPGSFFAASPLFCDFMNVAICGNPAPGKYTNGMRDWPSGNLGAVLRVMPTRDTYIMAAVFATSPHAFNGGISGWSWGQSGLGKLTTPVELGWLPSFGHQHLVGHYKLGFSYDNSRYHDLYEDNLGTSYQTAGLPARTVTGQNGVWLQGDQMLIRNGAGATNGLVVLAGAMYADGRTVAMRDHTWVGAIETGQGWHRPLDTVGVMWQHFDMGHTVALQQEASLALQRAYLANQWGAVYGIQSHENVYELFYSVHVARATALQPDFQYVQRPGATTTYKDAAVFGLQFTTVL